MKRPRSGWPNYKSIKKRRSNKPSRKLSLVFFFWGGIGLLTSWHFNDTIEERNYNVNLEAISNTTYAASVGPITTTKYKEVYEISLRTTIFYETSFFVESEVLDENKQYLYSFGEELWYERGYDSDGSWTDTKNTYEMKVTFAKPGRYYLNFKAEDSFRPNKIPRELSITLSKKRGSALPHFWFGILSIVIGLFLYTKKSNTRKTEQ